ncbi:MAG: YdcF family protein [Chloroflexi bacterium]|nr:YdcF family protein [Chloroflexota bacterium]
MMFKFIFYTSIIGLMVLLLPRIVTGFYANSRIKNAGEISPQRVAIVFGAGLWRDGSPTPVLRDRVATAAELYFTAKVEKLLMSGDNSIVEYNEPEAMREHALELGVPDEDIVLDYAGRRTYDTCYRAKSIFKVDQAILVTQQFHLPRAIYLCNAFDIQAEGVVADQRVYQKRSLVYWHFRELFATVVALWQVHITQPIPILGNIEPIFRDNK